MVKPKTHYEYENIAFICTQMCCSLKEKKKLFIRRKVQLNSEIFNVIWKAFFLQDHNNDLLIYKGLCFRGSQNFP